MSRYIDNLAHGLRLGRKLERVCAKRFGEGVATLDALIRANERSVVFAGHFRGQPAVFKHIQEPKPDEPLREVGAVIARYEAALGTGQHRVTPLLAALPGQHLLILGKAPGEGLDTLLARGDLSGEAATDALCGWLSAAARMGGETVGFAPQYAMEQLRALDLSPLPHSQQQRMQALIAALKHWGTAHRGADMYRAVGHGDCHAGNFTWDGTALWAFDLQSCQPMPVARMGAKFLALKQMRHGGAAGLECGIAASDLASARATLPLAPGEGDSVLPFFLGVELLLGYIMLWRRGIGRGERRAARLASLESALDHLAAGIPRKEAP